MAKDQSFVRRTFIALGTNLPFAGLAGPALLAKALESIQAGGVKVLQRSQPWVSPPWPASLADQPPYTNQVAEVDPLERNPLQVFAALADVEARFGRERRRRWAARTLDLDLLDFKGEVGRWGAVEVPHPRLHERVFVLAPLLEIAPDWRHPVSGRLGQDLLAELGKGQGARPLN